MDINKKTFSEILKEMNTFASANIDKREGSLFYDAVSPVALEIAEEYATIYALTLATFVTTSWGSWLDLICYQVGITRNPATQAIKEGSFYDKDNNLIDIDLNSQYVISTFTFTATERISQGLYQMQCDTAGSEANGISGELRPLQYNPNLALALLNGGVLIPGEDEESDTHLKQRYIDSLSVEPYGGNIADYRIWVMEIDGVGDVKVYPIWNGGGTVKLTIIDSDYNVPSQTLIDLVQVTIDPVPVHAQGRGKAPIGHYVTVFGATSENIDIIADINVTSEFSIAQLQPDIESSLSAYLLKLITGQTIVTPTGVETIDSWGELETPLTITISNIINAILDVPQVLDVQNVKINGSTSNFILALDSIPKLGVVTLGEL